MGLLMKKLAMLFCATALLLGCGGGGDEANPALSERDTLPAPIVPGFAYWQIYGTIDSVGHSVKSRQFLALASDSTFWMYISPASLPLYHARSPFDVIRLTGKMLSSSSGKNGSVTFLIDSTKSQFNDGSPVLRGSILVNYMYPYYYMRYVKFNYLSPNEKRMAYGEYSLSHVDSGLQQMASVLNQ